MEHNIALKKREAKSLQSYLDAQDAKLDMLKDFVANGYTINEELVTTMKVFQDRGLEVYKRYTRAQKKLIALKNYFQNQMDINRQAYEVYLRRERELFEQVLETFKVVDFTTYNDDKKQEIIIK